MWDLLWLNPTVLSFVACQWKTVSVSAEWHNCPHNKWNNIAGILW